MRKEKQTNTSKRSKTCKLLERTIYIKYVDKVLNEDGDWRFAICHYRGNKIYIEISLKDVDGNEFNDDELNTTLRHELYHAIFDIMMYFSESENESLVEWLAQATKILHKQGVEI